MAARYLFLPVLLAGAAHGCPAQCADLAQRVRGDLTCNVTAYDYSWGNRICFGILPACVLRPRDAHDVAAAVRHAKASGAELSYRSGGHSYTCNGIKEGSIHLDLRSLDRVSYVDGLLTTGSGAVMRQLIDALPEGKMIVHGQCPEVGAGGLFLHGGWHTTLSLAHGSGNDTVVGMEVVTAAGDIVELHAKSPHQDLWRAMRTAGSSFALATRIVVQTFDVPADLPTDGGDPFVIHEPRAKLLGKLNNATAYNPGLPSFVHINGIDVVIVAASKNYMRQVAFVESWLGRALTDGERAQSKMIRAGEWPASLIGGGSDLVFGKSGELPYELSSQNAFATVSFLMPMGCYEDPRMVALLADAPNHRDNMTDLGCYLQVCTTYDVGIAAVDYNCAYDSAFYQARQQQLNDDAVAICPEGMVRYVNTPSTFLTARDYYGGEYDALAATKAAWDPSELFRVYQGVRPTGVPPDNYTYTRPYVRNMTTVERLEARAWDAMVKVL